MKPRLKDVEERVDRVSETLETLDTAVLGAVSRSLDGLLTEQATQHREKLTSVALQTIKSTLSAFPTETQLAVSWLFDERLRQAEERGGEIERRHRSHIYGRRQSISDPVQIRDLLGLPDA